MNLSSIPNILGQVVSVAQGVSEGLNEETGKHEKFDVGIIKVINGAGELVEHLASPDLQLMHVPEGAQDVLNSLLPVAGLPVRDSLRAALARHCPSLKEKDTGRWLAVIAGTADEVAKALANDGKIDWREYLAIAKRAHSEYSAPVEGE